ncbi:MAG: 6-carboxytetrahydropterin synthase QueD [Chloroflexi bacterium RBG_16_50_9]|nr:MAG: 6-carboxytetrahydropterin synthase QueD [Chloroflexi bacterium RBG_16_50_9]
MYEISIESHFDAAHFLRGYRGKCEALHGHRYRVVARIRANRLDDIGLAYDFTELKGYLNDILSRFDHVCLNDIKPFDRINPSAENIAATIYEELKGKMAAEPVTLTSVEAWESPTTGVIYSPG